MILPALVLLSVCCPSVAEATGTEIVCSSEPVEAVYSERVTLLCHLKPPMDVTDKTVKWTRRNDVVLLRQGGKDIPGAQREQFEGRALLSLEGLTKGNLSLQLSSLMLSDSGRYKCSFITENLEKSCHVNLTVGESDVIGSGDPVKANIRQDVVLPCHLEPPFNVSTLTVEWKHNNSKFVHIYRSRKDDPTSQDNQFKNRTSLFPEEMEKGNISLLLRNVSKADEGLYICHVPKLHSQVRKGNITLIVAAAGRDTKQTDGPNENVPADNSGTVTGAVIAGIAVIAGTVMGAFIAVIAVIIFEKTRNRQVNGNNQQAMDNEMNVINPQEQEQEQGDVN